MNEGDAASLLGLDRKSYLFKEQGKISFERKEIVELWNWFNHKIELLPTNKQRYIQLIMDNFPPPFNHLNNKQGEFFNPELPEGIISTVKIRVPVNFIELLDYDTVINYSGSVNNEIADKIKNTIFYSQYPAFDFNGIVWWHEELGYWAIQIHQLREYRETLLGEYLDEIVTAIRDRYGKR